MLKDTEFELIETYLTADTDASLESAMHTISGAFPGFTTDMQRMVAVLDHFTGSKMAGYPKTPHPHLTDAESAVRLTFERTRRLAAQIDFLAVATPARKRKTGWRNKTDSLPRTYRELMYWMMVLHYVKTSELDYSVCSQWYERVKSWLATLHAETILSLADSDDIINYLRGPDQASCAWMLWAELGRRQTHARKLLAERFTTENLDLEAAVAAVFVEIEDRGGNLR